MNCTSCGAANGAADKFCHQCGARLAAIPTCRSCGSALAAGSKFCTTCGTAASPAPEIPQGPGYVVDGEWHRAPGEFVRRVPGDALRSAFGATVGGVDWGAFLRGTAAGKLIDALLSRSIRVPMGSVGVVTRDGKVVKVLPPGDQTTPGLLRDLVDADLKTAAASAIDKLLGAERFALYLVDRRPIPLSFTADLPTATGTRTIQATTLVSVGASPDALGAFLGDVVADRDTLSAEDVYLRFRSEIERAVTDALRARPGSSGGGDLAAAEKTARDALRARFAARTGLGFDLVLAPRHTVHRMDLVLGGGEATVAACPSCKAPIGAGQKFCTRCGATQPASAVPDGLYTSDGASIELDLALSVQGEASPKPPAGVLRSAAARHLRERPWTAVNTPDGQRALEQALADAGGDALAALGFRLLALELVDVRAAGDQWSLGARAAIEQAKAELRVGREWLSVRDDELAIEELGATIAAKSERIRRDAVFAARTAAVDDAKRLAELEAAERSLARARAEAEHGDALAADTRTHDRALAGVKSKSELDRERIAAESARRRTQAEDEAFGEQLKREARLTELSAMAEIDARMADQEQRHRIETMGQLDGKSEAQILAMQASDLASAEHGAAFADALARLADGEAARRERDKADAAAKDAANALLQLTRTAIESNAKVAAAKAGAPPAPTTCPTCAAPLAPGARFCGGCGTAMT